MKEQLVVSRKTSIDGKLEISAVVAAQLDALGHDFAVNVLGEEGVGSRASLECSCVKAAGERHVHHFVVSPVFRKLAAGSQVRVELDHESSTFIVELRDAHV